MLPPTRPHGPRCPGWGWGVPGRRWGRRGGGTRPRACAGLCGPPQPRGLRRPGSCRGSGSRPGPGLGGSGPGRGLWRPHVWLPSVLRRCLLRLLARMQLRLPIPVLTAQPGWPQSGPCLGESCGAGVRPRPFAPPRPVHPAPSSASPLAPHASSQAGADPRGWPSEDTLSGRGESLASWQESRQRPANKTPPRGHPRGRRLPAAGSPSAAWPSTGREPQRARGPCVGDAPGLLATCGCGVGGSPAHGGGSGPLPHRPEGARTQGPPRLLWLLEPEACVRACVCEACVVSRRGLGAEGGKGNPCRPPLSRSHRPPEGTEAVGSRGAQLTCQALWGGRGGCPCTLGPRRPWRRVSGA